MYLAKVERATTQQLNPKSRYSHIPSKHTVFFWKNLESLKHSLSAKHYAVFTIYLWGSLFTCTSHNVILLLRSRSTMLLAIGGKKGKKALVMNDFALTGAALHYNPWENAQVNVFLWLKTPQCYSFAIMKAIAECYLFSDTDSINCFLLFVFLGILQRFWQRRPASFPKYSEQVKGSSGQLKGTAHPDLKEEIWRVKRQKSFHCYSNSDVTCWNYHYEIICLSALCIYDKHLAMHLSRFSEYTNLLLNVGKHILPVQKILNQSNVGFNLSSLNIFSF